MRICFRVIGIAGVPLLALWAGGSSDHPAPRLTSVVRADLRTGKLVRAMVLSPAPQPVYGAPAEPTSGITDAIVRIAAEHALPPGLIHSVIKVESNYNPYAISPKGALGLMQLIPATARRFGVSDVFNPEDNIRGGARYLRYLLDLYNGDYQLALAAYNAGEEAVARYGGVPPFPETQNYVLLVRRQLEQRARLSGSGAKESERQSVEAADSGPSHIQEIVQADGTVRYVSR
jgi:soluble lytic murein transglycosylase-like protein